MYLGEMTACTKRTKEAAKGLGQRYVKGDMKDFFLFDSWFDSKMLSEAAMDVGTDMIGMVKTNTKLFCKDIIENLTKD